MLKQKQLPTTPVADVRPHHWLVQNLERNFLGLPTVPPVVPTVVDKHDLINQWLTVCILCFVVSLMAQLILS